MKFQKNYETSDFNDIDGTLTELKEMQQILRDKFTKKSKDLDEEDYNSKRIERKTDYFCFSFNGIDKKSGVLGIYVLFILFRN